MSHSSSFAVPPLSYTHYQWLAMVLRIGLGLVFVIGGWSKLGLLLNDATHDGMVANYMGTTGYINALFQDYLFFEGSFLTPAGFLTTLSAFELISGLALVAGLFVRPLALFYGLLLWSFVVSLPVHTVPGVGIEVKTYTSPAIFVQIRDITLSGMMFVLFNLGAGARSLDNRLIPQSHDVNWQALGLLLRFSLGAMLIVGGFFGSYAKVPTFATAQWLLAITGLVLIFGHSLSVRAAGVVTTGVMIWYMATKLNVDKTLIKNLNSFKREFALASGGIVVAVLGGGHLFTLQDIANRFRNYFQNIMTNRSQEHSSDFSNVR